MRKLLIFSAFVLGITAFTVAEELPKGPGAQLVYKKCQMCHGLQNILDSKGITRKQWKSIIQEMKANGLEITPEEERQILDYLSTYLGPSNK